MTPTEVLPPILARNPSAGDSPRGGGLRALPGRVLHALLPLIKLRTQLRGLSLGVRVCVRDDQGRVLLIRHSYLPGWHFPGGGVEFGETAAEAARRELAEEGGVELTGAPRLVGLFRNPEWTGGDHVAFFETDAWRPCPRKWGVEIEAAGFFAVGGLPFDVHPSVRRRLAERDGQPLSEIW